MMQYVERRSRDVVLMRAHENERSYTYMEVCEQEMQIFAQAHSHNSNKQCRNFSIFSFFFLKGAKCRMAALNWPG